VIVDQTGPACHLGKKSCFFNALEPPPGKEDIIDDPMEIFRELSAVMADRRDRPVEGSYVNRLLEGGGELIRSKVAEECREVVEASAAGDKDQIVYETADLLFHLMVLLFNEGLELEDAAAELSRRFGGPPGKGETTDLGKA
jgi:phosphoribosyl-ATP pyrophosphohydrolase/phosphoribosyl-AMP cyclohydrolase